MIQRPPLNVSKEGRSGSGITGGKAGCNIGRGVTCLVEMVYNILSPRIISITCITHWPQDTMQVPMQSSRRCSTRHIKARERIHAFHTYP